jgi:hypothetical protein
MIVVLLRFTLRNIVSIFKRYFKLKAFKAKIMCKYYSHNYF